MSKDAFLFPVLYLGPQEVKDAAEILNTPEPVLFKLGPLSLQPGPLEGQRYADVTEKQGRTLVKRFPTIFAWPEGTDFGPQMVSRDEYDALLARVDALEAKVNKAPKAAKEPAHAVA